MRQWGALRLARELRVGVEAAGAEDPVADLELRDRRADGCDLAGQLAPEDPPLRPAKAGEEAGEERLALRQPQSVRFTVVARILIRTSSLSGAGRSTSSSRKTSGGPYLS